MSGIKNQNDPNDIVATLNFKPRARLLLQLGDQLIKNESIALTELVKNSYDADANKVSIYMENVDSQKDGVIIIEDDGFGMTPEIVEKVWLEPGSDFKTQYIAEKRTTPKYNRLPIGEKGIGRFGVHKLGNVIEMVTKSEGYNEVYVHIDWRDFDNYMYLSDVPIKVVIRDVPRFFKGNQTGTNITVSNLRKTWERGIAREVKRSINSISSPFVKKDSFHTEFEIFDKPGWFEDLIDWKDVKEYSLYNFKIRMKGSKITFFDYKFTPWNTMSKLFPREVSLDDKLLETEKILKGSFKNNSEIINLDKYNVGEIEFEGFIFDLDSFVLKLGVSDKAGFKKYLKTNGGIKVFRDGLRVYDYGEPENDWLGLDYRRFQNPTKAISNNLIIGSISLNRNESTDLIEKTNREGFVENEAYHSFKFAILHCLDIVESLRQINKKKLKEIYGPTPKSAPLSSTISEAREYIEGKNIELGVKQKILNYFSKIEVDYKRVSENLIKAAGAGLSMSVVVHEVEKILFEVIKVLNAEKASTRVLDLVTHLSKLIDGYAEIIRKSDQTNWPISKIINQALFNTEYRLSSHNIEVVKKFNDFKGNQTIKISKNLILGTLINIIDNSIYWLDQKFISSKIDNKLFDKKIFIAIEEDANTISIIIADNGMGYAIPTEDITEPFVSAKPGGMGLGLHIASEIMEAHNGALIFPEFGDVEIPLEFKDGAVLKLNFPK